MYYLFFTCQILQNSFCTPKDCLIGIGHTLQNSLSKLACNNQSANKIDSSRNHEGCHRHLSAKSSLELICCLARFLEQVSSA